MGETVVLGWLALELTNSPFLVGAAMGARTIPLFFVGVPAGVLADRFPRRRLLMLTGAGQGVTAAAIGVLTGLGLVNLAGLLLLTLVALMLLTAGAEVLGFSHQALLPSLARDVLRAGPEGLGALNAARSIGGILGLLAVSTRRPAAGVGALFLAVLVSFGGSLVALGVAPRFVRFGGVLIVLIVANAAGGVTDLLAQSLMQSGVPGPPPGPA